MTGTQAAEEKAWAVRLMHRMEVARDVLTAGPLRRFYRNLTGGPTWPSAPGTYVVGDRAGSVAVCTLTSGELMYPLASLPGVAIAGQVYTANLGLEKIVLNVTDNPQIRFLVICGKDSPLFHPGQSLRSLWVHGVTPERRIIGAQGYVPELKNLRSERIECFRRQVELVDYAGETDAARLAAGIKELAERNPGTFASECEESEAVFRTDGNAEAGQAGFVSIRPGGRREPLAYDPKGFFIITVDREAGDIVVRHYLPDNSPSHIIRSRSAEGILLGLLREDLISQMSHAGYLGGELAKAETALRLGLRYQQDQALRTRQDDGGAAE
jgi:tetrahydromethanopterin S-methyltransferase subunit A